MPKEAADGVRVEPGVCGGSSENPSHLVAVKATLSDAPREYSAKDRASIDTGSLQPPVQPVDGGGG